MWQKRAASRNFDLFFEEATSGIYSEKGGVTLVVSHPLFLS
ncbi:hypothetical protein CU028_0004 [Enterococcus faecium]|nr:hypothetical protein [Enterococcus faecium]MBK4796870.1 hypothetical protein [Enterococcus faecium]MBK4803011.1 hypothetical protein [Enterococcus faecium]MBK4821357.1 hypothetical protein [Enterococcus faecium]MBK4866139.1 hypothetical protein [Enterococcus faecium]